MVCQSDVGAFVDSLVGWWVRGQSHRRIPSGFSLVDSSAHSSDSSALPSVDFRAVGAFVVRIATATLLVENSEDSWEEVWVDCIRSLT